MFMTYEDMTYKSLMI